MENQIVVPEQTKVSVNEWYEIWDGSGWLTDSHTSNGNWYWDTFEEAYEVAKNFKENPRSHNPAMTDGNVAYHQKRKFTIQKVTKTVIKITTI